MKSTSRDKELHTLTEHKQFPSDSPYKKILQITFPGWVMISHWLPLFLIEANKFIKQTKFSPTKMSIEMFYCCTRQLTCLQPTWPTDMTQQNKLQIRKISNAPTDKINTSFYIKFIVVQESLPSLDHPQRNTLQRSKGDSSNHRYWPKYSTNLETINQLSTLEQKWLLIKPNKRCKLIHKSLQNSPTPSMTFSIAISYNRSKEPL